MCIIAPPPETRTPLQSVSEKCPRCGWRFTPELCCALPAHNLTVICPRDRCWHEFVSASVPPITPIEDPA